MIGSAFKQRPVLMVRCSAADVDGGEGLAHEARSGRRWDF